MLTAISGTVTAPISRPMGARTRSNSSSVARPVSRKCLRMRATLAGCRSCPDRRAAYGCKPPAPRIVLMAPRHEDDETVGVQGARGELLRDGTAHDTDAGREKDRGGELRPIVDHRDVKADPERFLGNGLTDVPAAGNHQPRMRQDRLDEYLLGRLSERLRAATNRSSRPVFRQVRIASPPEKSRRRAGKSPPAIGLRLPARIPCGTLVIKQPRRRFASASAAWAKQERWRATVGSTSTRMRPPQIDPSSAAWRSVHSRSPGGEDLRLAGLGGRPLASASTAPPPTVPQRRPDRSTMALAPARCGVEPWVDTTSAAASPAPPSISSTIF